MRSPATGRQRVAHHFLILIVLMAWCGTACEAPHREAAPIREGSADAPAAAATRPAPSGHIEDSGSIAVTVTAGDAAVAGVEFGITTEDGQVRALFAGGSDAPAAPTPLPLGRYWVLAGRFYAAAPETTWEFSGVKAVALTKPGERATVEFAVPRMETVPFRVEPPRDSGVEADFFEYVEVELDQPQWNTMFTEFKADSFEVRGRAPVGKTVPLPVLPPGEYTVYVEYAAKRSLWTRTGDGPDDWMIPSVASHGDTITFPVTDDAVVVRPSLSKEDREAIREWAGRER